MNKLNKTQQATHSSLVDKLSTERTAVEEKIAAFNEKRSELWAEVTASLESFNTALAEARDFRDGITGDMESYSGDRSERWQEGDAGQAYESWKDTWESANLDDIDLDEPSEPEEPDFSGVDDFESLPMDKDS